MTPLNPYFLIEYRHDRQTRGYLQDGHSGWSFVLATESSQARRFQSRASAWALIEGEEFQGQMPHPERFTVEGHRDCSGPNLAASPPSLDATAEMTKTSSSSTPFWDDQEGAASPLINSKNHRPAANQLAPISNGAACMIDDFRGAVADVTRWEWFDTVDDAKQRDLEELEETYALLRDYIGALERFEAAHTIQPSYPIRTIDDEKNPVTRVECLDELGHQDIW